jgi:hypothetical protein
MRYGPHHFDADGFVSIWCGEFPTEADREAHLRERYGEEFEDEPLAEWIGEFGFGWFDHDFMDANSDDLARRPIRDLIVPCSYAASYVEAAVAAAEQLGIQTTQTVLLLFNWRYDPVATGVWQGRFLRFVGAFTYTKASDA